MRAEEPVGEPVPELNTTDPLKRAAAHADLGMPVPRKVRLRWLKLLVARMTWPTNRHQIDYNQGVIDAIEQLRRDLAAIPPPHDLAAHTEKHTVDLTADYNRAIAVAGVRLAEDFKRDLTAMTAGYATDLAALEAALRGEIAATLMRSAQQDGEIASASAVAATATAAMHDLRRAVDARVDELLQRFDRLEAAQARSEARARNGDASEPTVSTSRHMRPQHG